MVKTSKENKVQYVAPKAKVFEVRTESVICVSGQGNIDDSEEENWGTLQ